VQIEDSKIGDLLDAHLILFVNVEEPNSEMVGCCVHEDAFSEE
jgi:hypothetical protein